MTSSACVLVKEPGIRLSFDGVLSVTHSLSLKVSTDTDETAGTDYVNSARNQPDTVTLTVIASDVNSPVRDWSKSLLRALARVKEYRHLCRVVTGIRGYDDMLLTDLSVTQDESRPYGWTGTLTFTHAGPAAAAAKTDDNSSTRTPAGSAAVRETVSSGVLWQLLREAGAV